MPALREAAEQVCDAAGLAQHARAALPSRATARGEVKALITAQAAQRNVALRPQGAQPRAVSPRWRTVGGKRNC
jgi:hypothetical protein